MSTFVASMNEPEKKFLQLEKERIKNSANYSKGSFQNLEDTKVMGMESFFKLINAYRNRPRDIRPLKPIPAPAIDLETLASDKTSLVWFGHSSYFIQAKTVRILVDPVFSGHASPFKFMIKRFDGMEAVDEVTLPNVDVLVLTHDHYDHLDEKVIRKIKDSVVNVVCSLGVGGHLVKWGVEPSKITDLDWWEETPVSGIKLTAVPGRHFSGRGLKRMQSLWSAFVLETTDKKIFIGGDSGYGGHFKTIGKSFSGFDLAILEAGQYNALWHSIHMMPEETVQAAIDLGAKVLMPVHWGKFALAMHSWKEPVERVVKEAQRLGIDVCTPAIGEKVVLGEAMPFEKWWQTI